MGFDFLKPKPPAALTQVLRAPPVAQEAPKPPPPAALAAPIPQPISAGQTNAPGKAKAAARKQASRRTSISRLVLTPLGQLQDRGNVTRKSALGR